MYCPLVDDRPVLKHVEVIMLRCGEARVVGKDPHPGADTQLIENSLLLNRDNTMFLRHAADTDPQIISVEILNTPISAARIAANGPPVFRQRDSTGVNDHLLLFIAAMNHRGENRQSTVIERTAADGRLKRVEENVVAWPDLVDTGEVVRMNDGGCGADTYCGNLDTFRSEPVGKFDHHIPFLPCNRFYSRQVSGIV